MSEYTREMCQLIKLFQALTWNTEEKTWDLPQNEFVSGYVSGPYVEHEKNIYVLFYYLPIALKRKRTK